MTSLQQQLAPTMGHSDLMLVRRAQSGERGAFDRLVLRYRGRVVKLAMRYTHNAADAEDAAQEAFLKAFRALHQFRCECAFYTWLYRIAINATKNLLRLRERDLAGTARNLQEQLQEAETPEGLTRADDICGMVNATLEALPAALRTAVTLREIDHLSYEQIAAAMATPVGTVRSRVFRARDVIHYELRRVCESGLGRDKRPHLPSPRAFAQRRSL
jgi:RNA polymerase sigma-70 factor (ECF subfamily)